MIQLAIDLPVYLLVASALLLPALFLARSVITLQIIESMVCVSCSLSLILFASWMWFFRDGLKAGFVPTEGRAAFARFAQAFWVPLVLLGAVVVLSLYFYRKRLLRLRRPII